MSLRAMNEVRSHRGVPRAELRTALDFLLEASGTGDLDDFFSEVTPRVRSYGHAWEILLETLRGNRERILAQVAESGTESVMEEVEEWIRYIEASRREARHILLDLGIEIDSPYDRAVKLAYELDPRNRTPEARRAATSEAQGDATPEHIRAWLQTLYDQTGVAADVLRTLRVLLESDKSPTGRFLWGQLEQVDLTDAYRFFKQRVVRVHSADQAQRRGQMKRGDSGRGILSRRVSIRRYCEMTREKREERWVKLSRDRDFPYAGRRKDIVDADGHYPYFMSIYASNLARRLSREGTRWFYRPHAFPLTLASEKERMPEKSFLFEPDFYLPDTETYLVIIADRRQKGPGSMEERLDWTHQVRALKPEFEIEVFLSTELENDEENVRLRQGKIELVPSNIRTEPEKFLLADCPCARCVRPGF